MTPDRAHIIDLLIGASTFILVLSLWFGLLIAFLWRRSNRDEALRERLGYDDPARHTRILRLWHEGREVRTLITTDAPAPGILDRLRRSHHDAGWSLPLPVVWASLGVISILVAAIAGALTRNGLFGLAVMAGMIIGFFMLQAARVRRHAAKFDHQLVDSLELAARSLRAGHPLAGALRLVSEEMPRPISQLFADVCQQHELGVGIDQSLKNEARHTLSKDLNLFATSVALQVRSGGNLADMMGRLASVIKDRERLSRRVKVLTAQTQFSKMVLIALPILVFIILNFLNPEYMQPMYETTPGKVMLTLAASGLILGWWVMQRMAVVRY